MKEEKVLQLEDEIEDLELECATDDVIGKAQQSCKSEFEVLKTLLNFSIWQIFNWLLFTFLEQRIGQKSDNVHFFVYTILNFPRFFSAESGPSKVREIQNSENKKCTISEF